ncbi:MAG: hypothetical protein AUH35_04150 [Nitrospirae bacterium 13_1_40CM_62_7]|nr:MAG: hypothetical protein AUH35_04150 [Nitrospirae bacterium 13_1_40CM_62_7]OLC39022.1 MAG: hypothetical protein AUH75_09985 [Gemmatimonadetes bacterium 13_1_40CM_4_65_7]
MPASKPISHPPPYLKPGTADGKLPEGLRLKDVPLSASESTLCDIGLATLVTGPKSFASTILVQPFDSRALIGIDPYALRVFRWDDQAGSLKPVWNSGANVGLGYVWAKIERPGEYVPIGLPRDRLLQQALRTMAEQRRYVDSNAVKDMEEITAVCLAPLIDTPLEELDRLRRALAVLEVQSTLRPRAELPITIGRGGYLNAFPLPRNATLQGLRERLGKLRTPHGGLPEEALFFRPELFADFDPPWPVPPGPRPWPLPFPWPWPFPWPIPWPRPFPWPWPKPWFCFVVSKNWWMYHHDQAHSGHSSGCSSITSASVGGLRPRLPMPVALNGTIYSIPTIVDGKIYVGTTYGPGGIGTLYKIDLFTGNIDDHFDTPVGSGYAPGIGGSPAVVHGKAYITNIPGTVQCVDLTTMPMSEVWRTDLRVPSQAQNQPVSNPYADCWTGPLVVNGRVYVGCGEGEYDAYGFVYCLDANTGRVVWLFSTNKYNAAADNAPNAIPQGAAVSDPLPAWAAGFTVAPEPPVKGCSVWSSPAYDSVLDRIYVGTGNSTQGDANPQPDMLYGSGVLSLDAATGQLRGFYEPTAAQSYRANDTDVDVCGSPLLFANGGQRLVAIGSKSGAFFLFDAATMALIQFRQLLPYINDNPATPVAAFDSHPGPGENLWGVFGTPAVHYGLGCLYVGLGGYGGIDGNSTPFLRALDWATLADRWVTAVGADGIRRYTVPAPPMYATPEAGLSSPAVVNDVVFITTSKPGLYALDAATGLCLWSASGLTGDFVLGPAIYGDFVVVGAGNMLDIWSL